MSNYTESKLVVYDTYRKLPKELADNVTTYDHINAEINKMIAAGWTPVSISSYDSTNGSFAVLFCK